MAVDLPGAYHARPGELAYSCEECGKPIDVGDEVIRIDYAVAVKNDTGRIGVNTTNFGALVHRECYGNE